jgi:hypothetical protein
MSTATAVVAAFGGVDTEADDVAVCISGSICIDGTEMASARCSIVAFLESKHRI